MGFVGGYTGGTVLPLNVDLSETTQSKVLPVDLAIDHLQYADYISIVNDCVCRRTFKCQDYPKEIGCLFFNSAGRRVVELGIAKEGTIEEAKAHILKAKDAGLFCNVEIVEGEQFVWELKNDQMNEFKMMYFCCTCCCLAMRMCKGARERDVKRRYQSCGFCTYVCEQDPLSIKQTFPMRETVNDYFLKEIRIDDIITAKNIAEKSNG